MDVFRGKPVVHIPMDKDQTYYFSFGLEKAEIIDKLVASGEWNSLITTMRAEEKRLREKKIYSNRT